MVFKPEFNQTFKAFAQSIGPGFEVGMQVRKLLWGIIHRTQPIEPFLPRALKKFGWQEVAF